MNHAPIVRAADVRRSPEDAFRIFTEEIGAWWPLPSHGIFGARAGGLYFRDGKLVEQATNGEECIWGDVQAWDPPRRLVVTWHPGSEATEASEVEVVFEPTSGGTRVIIEHRGWERFGAEAASRRNNYIGPNAWGSVLDHFGDSAEPGPAAIDATELAAQYEAFFDEARTGGFGPAPEGEWNAEQVVAHVALNDLSIVAVTQSLVHRNLAPFENQVCQDPTVLAGWIEQCGDMAGLISRGRAAAAQVVSAVQRLSPEQQAHELDCRISHDGEIVAKRPMPWCALAVDTQATVHLPAHIEQLRNLRTARSES